MPLLDRVLAARRPAGVLLGFRGIAASNIEALQCNVGSLLRFWSARQLKT